MGYAKEKYTDGYFLNKDDAGNDLDVGVAGIDEFRNGDIRMTDKLVLERIDFSGLNVIDFGFGRGEAIRYALEHGARKAVGVDFSESGLRIADEMLRAARLIAELHCADALEYVKTLPSSTDPFDIVIMFDFVEHVPRHELRDMFSELRGHLAEHALICVNTPVFKVDNDVIRDGLKDEARDTSDENEKTAGMHCNRYTKESLRSFMEECGYHAVSGHYFTNIGILKEAEAGTSEGWRKAVDRKFHLKGEWAVEYFEYAKTSEEIRREAELEENRKYLVGDYDIDRLTRVELDDFSIDVTARYAGSYRDHSYERLTVDLFRAAVSDLSVVLDIGSHYGYYSLIAASKSERCKVYAFEPVEENLRVLNGNIKLNGLTNVSTNLAAVSDMSGEREFNVAEASDSSGFHIHPLARTKKKVMVRTVSIDDFMSEQEQIDVIKIDTEGNELSVLDGMRGVLARNPDATMFVEFNPKCLRNSDTRPENLLSRIGELGFDIYFVDDHAARISKKLNRTSPDWERLMSDKEYMNLLCVRSDSDSDARVTKLCNGVFSDLYARLERRTVECNGLKMGTEKLDAEIRLMSSSKFWATRAWYLKIKSFLIGR